MSPIHGKKCSPLFSTGELYNFIVLSKTHMTHSGNNKQGLSTNLRKIIIQIGKTIQTRKLRSVNNLLKKMSTNDHIYH